MKLVGIGDLFIPHEHIRRGFASLGRHGVSIETFDWRLSGFPELQNINHLVEEQGSEAYDPPGYVHDAVRDAQIVVTQFCPLPSRLIGTARDLKVIGVLRSGTENVDVPAATARSVLVFPNSGRIPDLPGKTVGIIGLGEIGRAVARRLAGFEVRILAHDPFVTDAPPGVALTGLEELMAESDFVTLHARLTKETEKIIGRELIGRMKRTAYFINTSRAGLVDEAALCDALREGRIEGAALDVFEHEPPGRDDPLVSLPNVTLTPHMAGGSNDAFFNSPGRLAREIEKLWQRERSRFIVNGEIFAAAMEGFRR